MKSLIHPPVSIAYCTVCMNRLHHLKRTLPSNLEANREFDNVRFFVLDYNSSDGLEGWVRDNLDPDIRSGYLTYYRHTEALVFLRSHSRNIIFKLADADVVCNVDADNVVNGKYTQYVLRQFQKKPDIFITADGATNRRALRDSYGRFCCRKEDFLQIGGYDEAMRGYGYEDSDIYSRLERLGRQRVTIGNAGMLRAIVHEDIDRVKNDPLFKDLDSIYAADAGDQIFQIVILLNTGLFEFATCFPGKYRDDTFSYGLGGRMTGMWKKGKKGELSLVPATGDKMMLRMLSGQKDMFSLTLNQKNITFKRLRTPKEIGMAVVTYMMVCNQERYQSNKRCNRVAVNESNFGRAYVYRNFDDSNAITVS